MLPFRSAAAVTELLQSQLKWPLRAAVRAPPAAAAALSAASLLSGRRAAQPGGTAGFRGFCTPAKGHSDSTSDTSADK